MTGKSFKVIRASAGSGKTYALVRQYLILALQSDYPAYYRHILAITFTNAAAAEMKERVMMRLREFALGTRSPLAEDVASELGITVEKLAQRATSTYKDMLHHYSYLGIQTIDSFTHKIIRSFARDLRLHHDFNIEADPTKFLEKLAESCLQKVGEDEELTKYLQDFLIDNIDEGKRLRLHDELIEASKILLKEDTQESLEKLGELTLAEYGDIRKKILTENRIFKEKAMEIAQRAIQFFNENGLIESDFYYGGSGTYSILKSAAGGEIKPAGVRMNEWTSVANKASGKASAASRQVFDIHAETINGFMTGYSELVNLSSYRKYLLNGAILQNLHTTGLIENLNEIGTELREKENVLLISDFHKKVNEIVRNNHAPFIYERIGIRYKHILIDEFQDTSLLQWSNTLPLLEEALSQRNTSLIVGDAKQSIYRWRGGNVEQFIDLPEVPEAAGRQDITRLLKEHIEVIELQQNRRSKSAIVEFNNRLFKRLSGQLGKYRDVYSDIAQIASRGEGGYVRIETSEHEEKKQRNDNTRKLILQKVHQCLANGFLPGDIAILVRRGEKEGTPIAEMLVEAGFKVVTRESFLVQHSPVVRVIMGFLAYTSDPSRIFYGFEMVMALSQIHKAQLLEQFTTQYTFRKFGKTQLRLHEFFIEQFELDLSSISGTPYDRAIHLMRKLNLALDTATEYLLEKIRYYCIQKQWSLHEFIVWWEDSREKLFTATTTDNDSIQIMTVHKSKGLQFPVVIYPRFASTNPPKQLWVNTENNAAGLPRAYLKYKKPSEKDKSPNIPEFELEYEKDLLDDANVTYVAMTRAEERLYVIQETGGKSEAFSSIFIRSLKEEFQEFAAEGLLTIGTENQYQSTTNKTESLPINISREDSIIRDLRVIPSRIKKDKLRAHGELMHECLAGIKTFRDISSTVSGVLERNGIASSTRADEMVKEIQTIFSNDVVASWFREGHVVYNEREIILPGGRIARPDRVIISDSEVLVVDYKTGEPSEAHNRQVKQYMEVLSSMYQQQVRGFLLYTKTNTCFEVHLPS
jgi:ATP-dependent exoDNAse (exonuclease V) beta subunit